MLFIYENGFDFKYFCLKITINRKKISVHSQLLFILNELN